MMEKTTLAQIYVARGFQPYLIDVLAGTPAGTTDNMMQGIPVTRPDAESVLAVLSRKFSENYHLNSVLVALLEGEINGGTTPTNTA